MKTINVNIWDDYVDDGYETKENRQETHVYIECEEKVYKKDFTGKELLEFLVPIFKKNLPKKVKVYYRFYDSRKDPEMMRLDDVDNSHAEWHYSRDEIFIQKMSHKNREKLVEKLKNMNLEFKGYKLNIYSES